MNNALDRLMDLVATKQGIGDKARLAYIIASAFQLTQDGSVYYCEDFAVRFSTVRAGSFANNE